jgi:hypothetical protein
MDRAIYHHILKNMIIDIITNSLTIGRRDNDLEEFTVEEIQNYIQVHDVRINEVIQHIINDFEEDNELEQLEFDWIEEYLDDYGLL